MSLLRRLATGLLSPLIVLLAMPGTGIEWLCVFWFVPIAIALDGTSIKERSAVAFSSGVILWVIALWWLMPALADFSGAPAPLSVMLLLAFCVWQSVPLVVFSIIDGLKPLSVTGTYRQILWRAAIFTLCLLLIPVPLAATPWVSLYLLPEWIQLLSLGGMALLVFVYSVIQFGLVAIWLNRRHVGIVSRSAGLVTICLALIVFTAIIRPPEAYENALSVGVIQPDFTRQSNTVDLFSMSDALLQKKPLDLLVWPEFPPAFSAVDNDRDASRLMRLSENYPIPILVVSSYVYADTNNHDVGYFNASQWFEKGKLQASYNKQRLVPFFEYLPVPALRSLFPDTLNYLPGHEPVVFDISPEARIIPLVCYEMLFDPLIEEFVDKGGNMMVNQTSDTWFDGTPGGRYHMGLAVFQVVKYGLPLVRVANSGITATVDANGSITHRLPEQERGSAVMVVAPASKLSFFARFGDWFFWVLCVFVLANILFIRRSNDLPQ